MLFDKQQLNQLYRYCYALTVHRDDAYDLLQSALEKYLKNPPSASYSESAYLRRIIRNQFIDNIRRINSVKFESLDTGASESSSDGSFKRSYETNPSNTHDVISIDSSPLDEMLINEEMVDWIWSILDTIEREIVFLWAVEGYTAAEVSTELDMPRGTVLSRIHRLRKKINVQLAKDEAQNPGITGNIGKKESKVVGMKESIGESR